MLLPITARRLEWATLYTKVRRLANSIPPSDPRWAGVSTLLSVLRAYDSLRVRQPALAEDLWASAQMLARKVQLD